MSNNKDDIAAFDKHPPLSQEDDQDEGQSLSCCSRFAAEFKSPMFGLQEPHSPNKTIDLIRTFRPENTFISVLKLVWALVGLESIVQSLVEARNPKAFAFAYLSIWALWIGAIYLVLSAVWVFVTPSSPNSIICKATWASYSLGACVQFTATFLFWLIVYEPGYDVGYMTFSQHGILLVLVLFDGAVINRIPVRIQQIWLFVGCGIAYITWTVIHAVANIGNPRRNDGVDDDDAIYGVFSWNHGFVVALIISTLTLFVAVPIIFSIVWALSAWNGKGCQFDGSRRRYVPIEENAETDNQDVEVTVVE